MEKLSAQGDRTVESSMHAMLRRAGFAVEFLRLLTAAKPHHLSDWCRSWIGNRSPLQQGMPWLSWHCIDFLEANVRPGMKVLEYGGGGSSVFFLSRGCFLTTVEGHPDWAEAIRLRAVSFVNSGGCRFDLRFVNTHIGDQALTEKYIHEAANGGPWDLVLIDGSSRLECLAIAKQHLSRSGMIVFDNTDLPDYAPAYKSMSGFKRLVFRGLGFGRRSPTTTEVFHR